jgi:hypothetical protein
VNPFELRLTLVASGPTPVDIAWQRYEHLDLWPTWSPQLRSVSTDPPLSTEPLPAGEAPSRDRAAEPARLRPGLTGRVHGPAGVWARFEVLSVDAAAMRWTWRVRRGPVVVQLEHQVESSADTNGSRTRLTLSGPAPVILGYAPVAWYALHRLVSLPA